MLATNPTRTRIFTVPNQLTFLRLMFLPFFIIAIKYSKWEAALGILAAAAISDGLDGLLARGLNQKTPLGAYLDPIADKLLLSSSYFVLALKSKVPWWLTILVLGRDMLLLTACAVILITVGYRPFPPSLWGKATTFFEILLIVIVLVAAVWPDRALGDIRWALSYIVATFVLLSGIHYSITVSRQLHAGH